MQTCPVEMWPWVALSTGCDVAVSGQVYRRMALANGADQGCQCFVLHVLERIVVAAFKLDTNREIIAALASAPARYAGMPGSAVERNKLDGAAVALDEQVG